MSTHGESSPKKTTVRSLQARKQAGEKIVCLTAYDASFARLIDAAGVDVVLVGDSLGMVVQGLETTLPVSVAEMLYHSQLVRRGVQHALLMVDMPFLSYTTVASALENAGRFMKQAGAEMVKLEGGEDQAEIVTALVNHGIPVCAHLGLQPQRVHKLGGYRVQGREASAAEHMLHEARVLQEAGADVMLLECVPAALAKQITEELRIPVIGIGAGKDCDGQILVLYDILGVSSGRQPKFAHDFLKDTGSVAAAINAYADAVRSGRFPSSEQSFD
jgi:3-methyl-2-oxobutanoate hydroxymethyltransferase